MPNQIWFVSIPLVENDPTNLSEIVIGFPFPAPVLIEDYLRRYLNDVNIKDTDYPLAQGTSVDLDTEVDGEYNLYLRRYLVDTLSEIKGGPSVDLDAEVDSEYNNYLRRYLNDKI